MAGPHQRPGRRWQRRHQPPARRRARHHPHSVGTEIQNAAALLPLQPLDDGAGNPRHYVLGCSFSTNGRLASTSPGCLVCRSCSGRRPTLGPRSWRSPCRSRARRWSSPPWSFSCGESAIKIGPHRFAYRELFYATKGFKDRNLVGAGSFGRDLSKASASALPAAARPLTPEPAPHRRRLLCRGHRVSFAWACLRGRRALLLLGGVVVKPAKGKRRGSEPSAWGMSRKSATRERAKPASGR